MFYVLSDDIDGAKKLLKGKMVDSNFHIAYPGTGRKHYPGKYYEIISMEIC